jgi:hypothetical protein
VKNKRSLTASLLLLSFALYACRALHAPSDSTANELAASGLEGEEGQAVRLALAQLGKDLPEVSFDDLSRLGSIGAPEVVVDENYSRSLREGLVGSVSYLRTLAGADGAVVRRDLYKVKADQQPFAIKALGKDLSFPFTLQAGGTIEIGRVFPDRSAAQAAKPFSFAELPFSLENMKKLAPGTYVGLPIKGSIALEANGNFLAEAARFSRDLRRLLSASSIGSFSHVSQGTLLAQGVFSLQLIRLDGDKVRVRIVHGDDLLASASHTVNFETKARLVFIPSSKLQKIRDIKEQLEKGVKQNPLRARLGDVRSRIEQFKSAAQTDIKQLFERVPGELENAEVEQLLELSRGKIDAAVEQAEQVDAKLGDFDRIIFGRADAMYDKLDAAYKSRIEPVLDKIKEHADRDLDLKGAVTLTGDLTRKVRTIADYVFDTRDPVALDALERAFFGRTTWLGATPSREADITKALFYDFATAESIATADQAVEKPRVIRLVKAAREFRESHLGVSFQGLYMKAGFDDRLRENDVQLTDRSGRREDWYSRVWEFNQNFKLASFIDAEEIYSSGFLTPKRSTALEDGAYWFAWQGSFGDRYETPIQRAIEAAHTFLGPVAVQNGVAAIYAGEFPGAVTARVQATFHGDVLRAFFDPRKADDALLWQALANLANGTNAADVGIPFSDSNITPPGLDRIKGAEQACELIAVQWGRLYCTIFQEDFLEKLREARAERDPVAKLSFFENYYKIGFLFNRLGTKLMVRYFAEVAHLLGMSQKVQIQVAIDNRQNPSMEASPQLKGGEAREIRLLEAMDMIEGTKK